jgi:dTDP-glucose pyrophosphorylase
MSGSLSRAVILARGLGTRMRREADGATLSAEQATAAESGAKAMMPIGRPFLDHVISAAADAGIRDVCLVIGPEHTAVREYYGSLPLTRVSVSFAVQAEPRGTADAVLAAAGFAGDERFLMINGDNFYNPATIRALAGVPGTALAGYARGGLVAKGNIPVDRVSAFAMVEAVDGLLVDIVEKPDPAVVAAAGDDAMISMNCFTFTGSVFDACRRLQPSARGEYEIVDAVRALVKAGEPVHVVPVNDGVLDLSSRADVGPVQAALAGHEVVL